MAWFLWVAATNYLTVFQYTNIPLLNVAINSAAFPVICIGNRL